ncbi:MAG: spore coat protein GerQ, partial [Bacillota bacterium]|nr:spore coat protein GerQ [Bacillota bacterium]
MNPYVNYNPSAYQPYQGSGGQQAGYGNPPAAGYGTQVQQPTGYPMMPMGGGMAIPMPKNAPTTEPQVPGMLPIEQSYIENILRLNKGKLVTVYTTFENNREWNAKIFKGIIEAAGRDHLILSDPQTGMRSLIPMVSVDY